MGLCVIPIAPSSPQFSPTVSPPPSEAETPPSAPHSEGGCVWGGEGRSVFPRDLPPLSDSEGETANPPLFRWAMGHGSTAPPPPLAAPTVYITPDEKANGISARAPPLPSRTPTSTPPPRGHTNARITWVYKNRTSRRAPPPPPRRPLSAGGPSLQGPDRRLSRWGASRAAGFGGRSKGSKAVLSVSSLRRYFQNKVNPPNQHLPSQSTTN